MLELFFYVYLQYDEILVYIRNTWVSFEYNVTDGVIQIYILFLTYFTEIRWDKALVAQLDGQNTPNITDMF